MAKMPRTHKMGPNNSKRHYFVRSGAKQRTERTYKLNGRWWRGLRQQVLVDEPFCRSCAKRNKLVMANEVDHIDGNPENNDRNNLQSLCKPCHSRKTAKEQNGFGNGKRKPPVGVVID